MESDLKYLGQLEDDSDGNNSTDTKHNDVDNYGSTATYISIHKVDEDTKPVTFVIQEGRPKRKRKVGPAMHPDTSLNEDNFDKFDPPIPNKFLENNVDEILYKWTAAIISSGRCNAAIIMPRLQKRVRNKKEPTDICTIFFTGDMVTIIFNNTTNKIMTIIKQLPDEVQKFPLIAVTSPFLLLTGYTGKILQA